tara:strand:- start:167661 stop:168323 length:663 start_codon:yes stop_codon:yes gene_type:complete
MNWTKSFQSFLFAAIVIPTNNLTEWKTEKFSGVPKNETAVSPGGLYVKVKNSAGPLIFPLKSKTKFVGFKIRGEFKGLPKITNPSLQGEKGFDDYPLRLGFVIPGEKKLSGFKKMIAAQWVKNLYEQVEDGIGIDSVHFFNVTQNTQQVGKIRTHPASDLFHEEFFAEVKHSGPFAYDFQFQKPIEAIAIWLSIDGDDTKSTFDVLISGLELKVSDEESL